MTEPTATTFRYDKPEFDRSKAVSLLGRTDIVFLAVQVVRKGGENNLHMHTHTDGFWFVLKGRVRFYTTDDEVVADMGPMEGILVPRGYPYWFESSGDVDLELLQFEASTQRSGSLEEFTRDRTNIVSKMDIGKVADFGEEVTKLGLDG